MLTENFKEKTSLTFRKMKRIFRKYGHCSGKPEKA